MKRTFVLFVLLAGATSMISAQFVFGVKPGLTMNSAQFGFKMSGLVLLGGLEFL